MLLKKSDSSGWSLSKIAQALRGPSGEYRHVGQKGLIYSLYQQIKTGGLGIMDAICNKALEELQKPASMQANKKEEDYE